MWNSIIPNILLILASVVALMIWFFIYFAPTIVGQNKANSRAIFVLNLVGGWTVIGWIVALVWACTMDSKEAAANAVPLNTRKIFNWFMAVNVGLSLIVIPFAHKAIEEDRKEERKYEEDKRVRDDKAASRHLRETIRKQEYRRYSDPE